MTSVTISVIIPTLNEGKSLPQTLACLSASGVTEVVIVDGGSLDKTISIAEAFAQRHPTRASSQLRQVALVR